MMRLDPNRVRPGRRAPYGRRRRSAARGFTLMETALAMVIVGVGLLSMLELLAAGTVANVDGVNETMGMNLARNVRERTLKLTYADVLALDNTTHSPPVNSSGTPLSGFDGWAQAIDIQPVDYRRFSTNTIDPNPDAIRVTVAVTYQGRQVYQAIWYRFRPTP